MATVFELPDELDLPEADQSQPESEAVCDTLADAGETVETTEAEVIDSDSWSDDDVIEIVEQPAETQPVEQPQPPVVSWSPPSEMVDLVECITDAEHDCCSAESLMEDLKEQLKEAKKHYETCVKRLRTFAREIDRKSKPVTPATPIQCDSTQPVFGGLADQLEESAAVAESISDSVQDDLAWRSVPLADIGINGIKGLGKKKLEALLELCPTLGAFEDLRARVGRDAATLPELMPKGIGQQACDALEEIVLDWLSKRKNTLAATTTKQLGYTDQPSQRAAELDNGQPNCLAAKQADDTLWKGGYRSYEDGVAITECPWLPSDNQDEWLRGWLAAKSVAAYEGQNQDPGETEEPEGETKEPKEETEGKPEAVPFDIDSL